MSFKLFNRQLTMVMLLAGTVCLSAQKPQPVSPLEIKLLPENDTWRVVGHTRISDQTGFPAAIYQPDFPLTPADPEIMAREYLLLNQSLLGLTAESIQQLKLHAVSKQKTGTTVRLRQMWKGLPVNKNAEITIHISRDNLVSFVMNGLQYGIQLGNVVPTLNAAAARQVVANHLGITGSAAYEANQLMVFHHQGKDYLVYMVTLVSDAPLGEWEAFVDAHSGALLKVEDISSYHGDHGQPGVPRATNLLATVDGTGNTFNPDPLSTANAVYGATGFSDGADANTAQLTAQNQLVTLLDITESAGVYSLVGPYAEIQDFEAPNKGLFTQNSSAFTFSRSADAFEVVNCYYHIDNVMRYLNVDLGVTVMPYQYSGGVVFDPSGLNGADNSHYISGTGRIAFGEGGVDDAEDADVVVHELGHGLHDWITMGGLSQVNGLSEGSGDYMAASYSRNLGNWPSSNAAYNWTFNWDGHNPFWGGRIVNYGPIYPGGLVGQIHTDGQIWATAMMRVWDDIGRQKADQAFWLGLDVTNSSTNQNDAANAVYQAAINLGYSTAQRLAIHTRFTAAGYTLPAFPLPVELVRFDGKKSDATAVLTWTTANERNNDHFTIERSVDSEYFSAIGTVKGSLKSDKMLAYTLVDQHPFSGVNYYRLKQTDIDGVTTISSIIAVDMGDAQQLEVFPNPVGDVLTIRNKFEEGVVSLYDVNGKLVLSQTFSHTQKDQTTLQLNGLPEGMYWMKLMADGQLLEGKVYKQ